MHRTFSLIQFWPQILVAFGTSLHNRFVGILYIYDTRTRYPYIEIACWKVKYLFRFMYKYWLDHKDGISKQQVSRDGALTIGNMYYIQADSY